MHAVPGRRWDSETQGAPPATMDGERARGDGQVRRGVRHAGYSVCSTLYPGTSQAWLAGAPGSGQALEEQRSGGRGRPRQQRRRTLTAAWASGSRSSAAKLTSSPPQCTNADGKTAEISSKIVISALMVDALTMLIMPG